jgi:hypothetical protein
VSPLALPVLLGCSLLRRLHPVALPLGLRPRRAFAARGEPAPIVVLPRRLDAADVAPDRRPPARRRSRRPLPARELLHPGDKRPRPSSASPGGVYTMVAQRPMDPWMGAKGRRRGGRRGRSWKRTLGTPRVNAESERGLAGRWVQVPLLLWRLCPSNRKASLSHRRRVCARVIEGPPMIPSLQRLVTLRSHPLELWGVRRHMWTPWDKTGARYEPLPGQDLALTQSSVGTSRWSNKCASEFCTSQDDVLKYAQRFRASSCSAVPVQKATARPQPARALRIPRSRRDSTTSVEIFGCAAYIRLCVPDVHVLADLS